MLPDRVSNPGPLTYELGALPIAPRGPAGLEKIDVSVLSSTLLYLKVIVAGKYGIIYFRAINYRLKCKEA